MPLHSAALPEATSDSGCQTQEMHFGSDCPASGHSSAAFLPVTGSAPNQGAPHTALHPPSPPWRPSCLLDTHAQTLRLRGTPATARAL